MGNNGRSIERIKCKGSGWFLVNEILLQINSFQKRSSQLQRRKKIMAGGKYIGKDQFLERAKH